jgi:MFS family permease
VILGWLLLDETDSAFVVGLGIALRSLPNLLFGLPGGALADRFDRRVLLRLTGVASGAAAGALAFVALAADPNVGLILLFTFLGGVVRALGQPARQSYAFDIVGRNEVLGGMAFLSLGQRGGGIAGAVSAGLLIDTWGTSAAYLSIAVCHLLSSAVISLARTHGQAAPVARPPVWQGLREYVGELVNNGTLRLLVILTAAVEMLGFSHQAAMPSIARDVLDLGPDGLGLLNAVASTGGLLAILSASLWGRGQARGAVFLAVLILFGTSLMLLGSATTLVTAVIVVTCVSALAALTDLLSQSLVQASVPNDLRGRAMGSWQLAIGFGPAGHVQVGALVALMGVTVALTTNGALLVALALAALFATRRIRQL